MQSSKKIAAIYARFSSDQQSLTSLDDQIRRCREVAEKLGCHDEVLIFTDQEVSGKDRHIKNRPGYHALKVAWQAGKFQVLICDELSRLARGPREQGALQDALEQERRVRLVTSDGIDSHASGWQFRFGMKGMMSQEELRNLGHRVPRGMQGQLERGHMIATPAYGYKIKRHYNEKGDRIATDWVIFDERAQIVRECYERRAAGQSYRKIAEWLNDEGIPIARAAREPDGGFWRAARIRNMLQNTIYRGVFVWHNSSTYRTRMKREDTLVEPVEYARPDLRLVSDELWHQCNEKMFSRTGYGSGRYALSGLISCGHCSSILAVSAPKNRKEPSLYCASCAIAKATDKQEDRMTRTINAKAVYTVLRQALHLCLAPAFLDEFHQALTRKLGGDNRQEIEDCYQRLGKLRNSRERYSRMIGELTEDDQVLEQRYAEARRKTRETEDRLAALEKGMVRVDARVVASQRKANPAKQLDKLFTADIPPEKLRSVLAHLFPKIVFEGKLPPKLGQRLSRKSIFSVHFAPGVALALASDTESILNDVVIRRIQAEYIPGIWSETRKDKKPPRPATWAIEVLETTISSQM